MPDLERHRAQMGRRPALILVDMINAFTDPASPLGVDATPVVLSNMRLLSIFRKRGLPIFFSTVVYHTHQQASVFRKRLPSLNILEPHSWWVSVDSRLAPLENEPLLEKSFASCFFGTDLAHRLQESGADALIVTGLTTSGCVRATVVDGLQHNYPVFVPSEAVGDRNPNAHASNLHDMHAKYAEVLDIAEIEEILESGVDGCSGDM